MVQHLHFEFDLAKQIRNSRFLPKTKKTLCGKRVKSVNVHSHVDEATCGACLVLVGELKDNVPTQIIRLTPAEVEWSIYSLSKAMSQCTRPDLGDFSSQEIIRNRVLRRVIQKLMAE